MREKLVEKRGEWHHEESVKMEGERREREREICRERQRKREMKSVRLFVWTEDLKHVVPLYTRIVRIEARENKKLPIGGMERAGECAGSREKNDAPSETRDRDEGR